MKNILIVDDEKNIRQVVREYCEFSGYNCDEASDGMEAIDKANKNDYDVIIMDIMMPRLDGYSACKEIKKTKDIPVIMLSARGEEFDKLFGFEIGIDDYIVKPFSPKELMARINVIFKHNSPQEKDTSEIITYKGLCVNFTAREVKVNGKEINMTPKEYDLLFYFLKNMNVALSREKLLEAVWGYDFYGDDRTVDTHVKMLRNSLGEYRDLIITLRGMGYKFEKI